jgi:hypothetical protein
MNIKSGLANRMLAGSTSDSGPYIWGGFDALRVCTFKHNNTPGQAQEQAHGLHLVQIWEFSRGP